MIQVDKYLLMAGAPYQYQEKCTIVPPTLRRIRECGYDTYKSYLSILLVTREELFRILQVPEEALESTEVDILKLITVLPEFRAVLLAALNFFIEQIVNYDNEAGYFVETPGNHLSIDDLWEIRSVILQFCYVEDGEEAKPKKFRNEKERKAYERFQKLKADKEKMKRTPKYDANMDLPNLIGSVSAFSSSYNLLNIWDLTICQFYDQFARLNGKIQLDIIGQRWAAWGKDSFDFAVWHQSLSKQPS